MKRALTSGLIRLQHASGAKLSVARILRQNMTDAELLLWKRLRNRKLSGFKFRRQQIVEGFIADFFCEEAKLAVEVDGAIHEEEKTKIADEHRASVFKARGILTLRIKNEEIVEDIYSVLARIAETCRGRL